MHTHVQDLPLATVHPSSTSRLRAGARHLLAGMLAAALLVGATPQRSRADTPAGASEGVLPEMSVRTWAEASGAGPTARNIAVIRPVEMIRCLFLELT